MWMTKFRNLVAALLIAGGAAALFLHATATDAGAVNLDAPPPQLERAQCRTGRANCSRRTQPHPKRFVIEGIVTEAGDGWIHVRQFAKVIASEKQTAGEFLGQTWPVGGKDEDGIHKVDAEIKMEVTVIELKDGERMFYRCAGRSDMCACPVPVTDPKDDKLYVEIMLHIPTPPEVDGKGDVARGRSTQGVRCSFVGHTASVEIGEKRYTFTVQEEKNQ